MTPQKNILIVDDYVEILELLENMFPLIIKNMELNCSILKFSNPMEALKEMGVKGIKRLDLILSDYEMPEMSGIELIKKIKKINSKVKVIVMSGNIYEAQKEAKEGEKDGLILVDKFISKPFDLNNLSEPIREFLN